ncbi:hypothetical protein C1H46_045874 [Malus baccata]|uniref:Uncharacterized protein n=1 Tax=Malus baccata TaxID=106549 RepID=A0A540K2T8_MALBA|nr:hypothetical protein C1H46_045874 [Malus baccata]
MKALIIFFLFSYLSFSPSSLQVADSQFEGYGDEINEDNDDYSSFPLSTRTRLFLTTAS